MHWPASYEARQQLTTMHASSKGSQAVLAVACNIFAAAAAATHHQACSQGALLLTTKPFFFKLSFSTTQHVILIVHGMRCDTVMAERVYGTMNNGTTICVVAMVAATINRA